MSNKKIFMSVTASAIIAATFMTAQTSEAATHTVKRGDSLWDVAQKYNTNVQQLKEWNNLTDNYVYLNQVLEVGDDGHAVVEKAAAVPVEINTYTVKKGDTLSGIVFEYGISVRNLMNWNGLDSTLIYPGNVFIIGGVENFAAIGKDNVVIVEVDKDVVVTTGEAVTEEPAEEVVVEPEVEVEPTPEPTPEPEVEVEVEPTPEPEAEEEVEVEQIPEPEPEVEVETTPEPEVEEVEIEVEPDPVPEPEVEEEEEAEVEPTKPEDTPVVKEPEVETTEPEKAPEIAEPEAEAIEPTPTPKPEAVKPKPDPKPEPKPEPVKPKPAPKPEAPKPVKPKPNPAPTQPIVPKPEVIDKTSSLISAAKSVIGTKYVWGGSTVNGFDCSGFIYWAHKQAGIDIGRLSTDGYDMRSYEISKSELKVGDLVFFAGTYRPGISHMGIYVGNNQFIHAGSSTGVAITSLDNPYWSKHFDSFKRFY